MKSKDFLRLPLTLLIICAVCTALVVAAHDYTAGIIASRQAAEIDAAYKQIFPELGKLEKVSACRSALEGMKGMQALLFMNLVVKARKLKKNYFFLQTDPI